MTEQPKPTPHDELADLIANGKLDDPKVIAGVLVRMAAAINDIKVQLKEYMRTELMLSLSFASMCFTEVHTMNCYLTEWAPEDRRAEFLRQREEVQEALKGVLEIWKKKLGGME
jgi:hypothetical protein